MPRILILFATLFLSLVSHAYDTKHQQILLNQVSDYQTLSSKYQEYALTKSRNNQILRIHNDKNLKKMWLKLTDTKNLEDFTEFYDGFILQLLGTEIIKLQNFYIQHQMDTILEDDNEYVKKIIDLRYHNEKYYFDELTRIDHLVALYMAKTVDLTEKLMQENTDLGSESLSPQGLNQMKLSIANMYLQIPLFLEDANKSDRLKRHYLSLFQKNSKSLLKIFSTSEKKQLSTEISPLIKKHTKYEKDLIKILDEVILSDCSLICKQPYSLNIKELRKQSEKEYEKYR